MAFVRVNNCLHIIFVFWAGLASAEVSSAAVESLSPVVTAAANTYGRHVLTDILGARVRELDRDLIFFNYEPAGPESLDVLVAARGKTERFFNVNYTWGGDVGPGLYAATDPVSSAYRGRSAPRLLAFKIRAGARLLVAENAELTRPDRARVRELLIHLGCVAAPSARGVTPEVRDYADLVSVFRSSTTRACRQTLIGAFEELRVQGILHPGFAARLPGCRTTGTALAVIDPRAIDWTHINWYSAEQIREGDPSLKPMIKALFEETKNDFGAQTRLDGSESWVRYRRGFDFFADVAAAQGAAYADWRGRSVLKCGKSSSFEDGGAVAADLFAWRHAVEDEELQTLVIQTAMAYNSIFRRSQPALPGASPQFNLARLKVLRPYVAPLTPVQWPEGRADFLNTLHREFLKRDEAARYQSQTYWDILDQIGLNGRDRLSLYNSVRLQVGQAPLFHVARKVLPDRLDPVRVQRDRDLLRAALRSCFGVYGNPRATKANIFASPCGVRAD